ncbi:MAG: ATP-dependent dethiobiotin synthetase BioD [Sphingobium sp.]|mgnify:CR=1 FL=1|nr:ATP-dependent dethiobiotin synthetase BioD [Sphingobium sp.]MBP6112236.1 ATP-dependent dethiobiotin synthetase BioD [Sphingobium sp.]MBP8671537.1 ATP-dependent dethiobiotin synthetase BioD [Sphingobium sp.]MBP9157323.1 ATP-dependent dethiobiotin synthetase BioD [Sphingobium sp.]MCC6481419.1 ATP-dependent dethiobiotin synthetase BioD [Sphingomonadaceae bacterium]
MSKAVVIAGTDTDVGKTLVSAGLMLCLPHALYWKPVQAGIEPLTDTEAVQRITHLPEERFLPEAYRLATPASPHLAARLDDTQIEPSSLSLPQSSAPLIIESAGGVMVPLNEHLLNLDLFARWGEPVILVARTGLGTINHSLLSIAALRSRDIPLCGIVFSGEAHDENERVIPALSGVASLGRLPRMERIDAAGLHLAMQAHVDIAAIEALLS